MPTLPRVALVLASAALVLAGCGSSLPSEPYSASQILRVDATKHVAYLNLVASATNGYSGFNFDGYGAGSMRVHIPAGWTVDVTCSNHSTAMTHSCAVIDDARISPYGGVIAFPGATIPDPQTGLSYGQVERFSFVASKVGTYRIACLIVGHEADGMWDWLEVTTGGVPGVTA